MRISWWLIVFAALTGCPPEDQQLPGLPGQKGVLGFGSSSDSYVWFSAIAAGGTTLEIDITTAPGSIRSSNPAVLSFGLPTRPPPYGNFGAMTVATSGQPGVADLIVEDAMGQELDRFTFTVVAPAAVGIVGPDYHNLGVVMPLQILLGDQEQLLLARVGLTTAPNSETEELWQLSGFGGWTITGEGIAPQYRAGVAYEGVYITPSVLGPTTLTIQSAGVTAAFPVDVLTPADISSIQLSVVIDVNTYVEAVVSTDQGPLIGSPCTWTVSAGATQRTDGFWSTNTRSRIAVAGHGAITCTVGNESQSISF